MKFIKIKEINANVIFKNSKDAAKFCKKFSMSSRQKQFVFATIAAADFNFENKLSEFRELIRELGGKVTLACDAKNLSREFFRK